MKISERKALIMAVIDSVKTVILKTSITGSLSTDKQRRRGRRCATFDAVDVYILILILRSAGQRLLIEHCNSWHRRK